MTKRTNHKNDEETTTFKKIMNYYGNFKICNKI